MWKKEYYNVPLSSNGEIEVPKLLDYRMFRGRSLNTAFITISVSDNQREYATIYITGEKGIRYLANTNAPLNIYSFQMKDLNINLDGKDLFQQDYAKLPKSSLKLSFPITYDEDNWVSVRGGLSHYFYEASNYVDAKIKLSEITSLKLPTLTFARFGDRLIDQNIELYFYSTKKVIEKRLVTVPLDVEALESLDTIDLN